MVKRWLRLAALWSLIIAGCKPSLDDSVSVVAAPSVLAIRSETLLADAGSAAASTESVAEAKPGEQLRWTALYADGAGSISEPALDWALCEQRKPLAELGPVNPLCVATGDQGFTSLGTGTEVTGSIPADACQLFGPDTPTPVAMQPPGRPVDPDSTGGYYQPLRILPAAGAGPVTIGETRITCTLASFSADLVAAFQQRYHRNTNPRVAALGVVDAASPWSSASDESAPPNVVSAGERVALRVSWPTCPGVDTLADGVCGPDETGLPCGTCDAAVAVSHDDCCSGDDCARAKGCAGAERYVVLDSATGSLVARREAMAVAWFATAGSFDFDRSGRSGDDFAADSDNAWQAPKRLGSVTLWVVLRDARGGVGWQEVRVEVR